MKRRSVLFGILLSQAIVGVDAFGQPISDAPFGVPLRITLGELSVLAAAGGGEPLLLGPEQKVVRDQAKTRLDHMHVDCHDFRSVPLFDFPGGIEEKVSALTACTDHAGVVVISVGLRNISFVDVVEKLSTSMRLMTRTFSSADFVFEAVGKTWRLDVRFMPIGSVNSSAYCIIYAQK